MKRFYRVMAMLLIMCIGIAAAGSAWAESGEAADAAVEAVSAQLTAIDSLQEMQDARADYDSASSYEAYLSKMRAQRVAAQAAYDALSDEQKEQIDASMTAKLTQTLSTTTNEITEAIGSGDGAYVYEAIFSKGRQYPVYEMSSHLTGEFPALLMLVDTQEYAGQTWLPDGLYTPGESNYHVTYCCDAWYSVSKNALYRRVNLEDSSYYSAEAAEKIRAIVQMSYPYVSVEQMKANLKTSGMDSNMADSLTRSDMIAAVQIAIWQYANADDGVMSEEDLLDDVTYTGTIDITTNDFFKPYHDYSNELWDYWNEGSNFKNSVYNEKVHIRINSLVEHLLGLEGVAASAGQIVVSDVVVSRTEPVDNEDGQCSVTLNITLNTGTVEGDNVILAVTGKDGTVYYSEAVGAGREYAATFNAPYGEELTVRVSGTQTIKNGVYFYEPKGGRTASQAMVGMASGETVVDAAVNVNLPGDYEYGLHLYKEEKDSKTPISDITFNIYQVTPSEGDTVSEIPTEEELEKYMVEEALIASITTDAVGYAGLELEKGLYLIEEVHNQEKVVAPIDPFYLYMPMTDENGELMNVVTVYPKNVPIVPELPNPDIDVPSLPEASFKILKHIKGNESLVLGGAQFQLYRPATEADSEENIFTITYGGAQIAVVPVTVDGEIVIMTSGADGMAQSPELPYGYYYLWEVKAPAGYQLLGEAIEVLLPDDEDKTFTIANESGTMLPSTGGSGIDMYIAVGTMLIVAAGVLWITRKRAYVR